MKTNMKIAGALLVGMVALQLTPATGASMESKQIALLQKQVKALQTANSDLKDEVDTTKSELLLLQSTVDNNYIAQSALAQRLAGTTTPSGFKSTSIMYLTLETDLGCNKAGIPVAELPFPGLGTLLQCALKVWGTTDGLPPSPIAKFTTGQ